MPTGETVFTVDGDGTMRRCHFVPEVLGNLYEPKWQHHPYPPHLPQRHLPLSHRLLNLPQLSQEAISSAGSSSEFGRRFDARTGDGRSSALLEEICRDPDDDTARLILADWLEERGDPRGEFIRLQCRQPAGESAIQDDGD